MVFSEKIRNQLREERQHYTEILDLAEHGYTYLEMSQLLKVPMGTVRSRLSRARARAKQILRENISDEQQQEVG